MKRLLLTTHVLFLVVVLLCSPSWATWSIVQGPKTGTSGGSPCAVTVTATGAGHVIIAGVDSSTTATITSVTGGGTYTLCGSGCRNGNSSTGFTDMAYTLSSTSGATSISIAYTGGTGSCFVVEFSSTTTFAFDASGSVLVASCTSACAAPNLTLTGSNDAVFGISSCGSTCAGTITGYTTGYVSGDGGAAGINKTSTAFNWAQSSSAALAAATIAIKETGGGGSTPIAPQLTILGVH